MIENSDKEAKLVAAVVRVLHDLSIGDAQRVLARAQTLINKTARVNADRADDEARWKL